MRGSVDSSVPGITSQRPRSHRRLQMSRHPPRITRQTPMSQNPFLTTKWGLRVIGAGRSDPLSEVTIRRASSRVSRCAADSLVAGSTYFGTCLRLVACTYLRGVLVEYLGGLP